MPRVKRSCVPCLAWQSMTLGPAKHEKEARTGRISNVLRISGARSAEKSVASLEKARVKRSCVPCFAWQSMTLGPAKHEKEARTGRISNVLRISGARSAEKSVASLEKARVKRSCVPCFAWQSMTLGPAKHEKEARTGRISNVLRISGARSAEKSVASLEKARVKRSCVPCFAWQSMALGPAKDERRKPSWNNIMLPA